MRARFSPSALPDGRKLGDHRADEVTREIVGALIRGVWASGRSLAIVESLRNPVRGHYRDLIDTEQFAGPNPAADLEHFVGRRTQLKARGRALPSCRLTARTVPSRLSAETSVGVTSIIASVPENVKEARAVSSSTAIPATGKANFASLSSPVTTLTIRRRVL